jgi:hypothetical protein
VQQVKYGSTLEAELIESRAQALQAKQGFSGRASSAA